MGARDLPTSPHQLQANQPPHRPTHKLCVCEILTSRTSPQRKFTHLDINDLTNHHGSNTSRCEWCPVTVPRIHRYRHFSTRFFYTNRRRCRETLLQSVANTRKTKNKKRHFTAHHPQPKPSFSTVLIPSILETSHHRETDFKFTQSRTGDKMLTFGFFIFPGLT